MGFWLDKQNCLTASRKYKSKGEFIRLANGAYSSCKKHGWLEEACQHMNRPKNIYWDKNRCLAEAKKYKTKVEFRNKCSSAYNACLKGDWRDIAFSHFKGGQKPAGYWNYENCKKEALKYKTLAELQSNNSSLFSTIYRNGWAEQLLNHIKRKKKPNGYWTKKRIKEEAKKFSEKIAFKKAVSGAYTIMERNGWVDEACAHMKQINKWDSAKLLKEAKKYRTKTEFRQEASGAYSGAIRRGILEEVTSHMKQIRRPNGYWSKSRLKKEAKKYRTKKEFRKKASGAYSEAYKSGWIDEACAHMEAVKNKVHWTKEKCKKEAAKYNTKKGFREESGSAYSAAYKHGWLNYVCKHMEQTRMPKGYWTKKMCTKEANKYNNQAEFRAKNSRAYTAAERNGWMKELTKSMPESPRPKKWTKEKSALAAKRYKSRTEFRLGTSGAYNSARRDGFLDEICEHMEVKGSRYSRAIYAFEFSDKSVYVGLTYNYDQRYKGHLRSNKTIIEKTQELGHTFLEFNNWSPIEEAAKNEAKTIENYRKRGWKILNKSKAGSLGASEKYWTKNKCIKEVKRYETKKEFQLKSPGAYSSASKGGFLREITKHLKKHDRRAHFVSFSEFKEILKKNNLNSHMAYTSFVKKNEHLKLPSSPEKIYKNDGWVSWYKTLGKSDRFYWTKEKCSIEARKYSYRNDFRKKSAGAYSSAHRKGWLDEICIHMKRKKRDYNKDKSSVK